MTWAPLSIDPYIQGMQDIIQIDMTCKSNVKMLTEFVESLCEIIVSNPS